MRAAGRRFRAGWLTSRMILAVLTLVLDAHTGQVEDLHLGGTEPEIGKLGQISVLK